MERTCMVLGGHGFAGSALVREARARGYQVTAVGRAEYDAAKGSRCHLLINAAGNSRKYLAQSDPPLDFDQSVASVLHSLLHFKANRYMLLSSVDVYPGVADPARNREDRPIDPARISPYGLHKHLAELLVRHHFPQALILRLGGMVGAGLWKGPVFDLLTGAPLRVHPDSTYAYVNTRDMASIAFDLLDREITSETLNVAGRGVISVRELAGCIPGARLPEDVAHLSVERYDINTRALANYVPVPATRDVIDGFLADLAHHRVKIGKAGAPS